MADLNDKPPLFMAGARSLSAGALNDLMAAIPRLIRGGAGVNVKKIGDRFIISLAADQTGAASGVGIATITDVSNDTYLVCDKDGATVNVARPWALRNGVDWPTGPEYAYDTPGVRVATLDDVVENQRVTPDYQVGEEILVARLPSVRIDGDDDESAIVWCDLNTAGRCWTTLEDV